MILELLKSFHSDVAQAFDVPIELIEKSSPEPKSELRQRCDKEFASAFNLAGKSLDYFAMGLIDAVQLAGHALLRVADKLHGFFNSKQSEEK